MFDQIEMAPRDAVFGLTISFLEDPRPDKVNLGVGIYRNAELRPVLFSSVKEAEVELAQEGAPRPYLPIDGDREYVELTKQLLFGPQASDQIYGAQTPGGTAALRIAGEFLSRLVGQETIYLPNPTWANHKAVFKAAGLGVEFYPYYDRRTHELAFDQLLEAFPEGSCVLFHAACHNPTGIDPSWEQWQAIADLVEKRNIFPIFDFAYQGFGDGLDEDARGVRHFVERGIPCFACYSYSKNLGLYGERTGAFFAHAGSQAEKVGSQVKLIARATYSNPPTHGAQIVKRVLTTRREEWLAELDGMRTRIQEMRRALMAGLLAKGGERDFNFLAKQKGLFSFSGLERDQVDRLIAEHGIYLLASGRINVTGLNSENLDRVVDAIVSLL